MAPARASSCRAKPPPAEHRPPRPVARKRPLDVETLWQLERVASVSLAPDGSAAACSVTTFSMDENKSQSSLWLLPTDGAAPRRLTRAGEKDGQPAWSPGGNRIAFLARREQEGHKDAERQLYVIDVRGGEAERKTDFRPGIEDFKWMPDGGGIVFVSGVWPELRGRRIGGRRNSPSARKALTSPPKRSTATSTAGCPRAACRTC